MVLILNVLITSLFLRFYDKCTCQFSLFLFKNYYSFLYFLIKKFFLSRTGAVEYNKGCSSANFCHLNATDNLAKECGRVDKFVSFNCTVCNRGGAAGVGGATIVPVGAGRDPLAHRDLSPTRSPRPRDWRLGYPSPRELSLLKI